MRIMTVELWKYEENSYYEAESLPEYWDEMELDEKYSWLIENAEYSDMNSTPVDLIEVLDVEVY